jgi:hypothetical protein
MLSLFAWSHSSYDVGAVCQTVFGIGCGDSSSETLIDDTSMFADSEILNGVFVGLESSICREGLR